MLFRSDLIRGGPTAATSYLRKSMGLALVDAMIPALGDAMRVANDPLLSQAITALAGIDTVEVARSVATSADNAIWSQIGTKESAIRANPAATRDPVLIAMLKVL